MKTWELKCSHCNTSIVYGRGNFEFSDFWMPYIRCNVCGVVLKTGAQEFLTMKPEDRQQVKATQKNCEYIIESIERTNNKEYLDKLINAGYEIYEPTQDDEKKFHDVDFSICGKETTLRACEMLYEFGTLIRPEELDEETGGYKEDLLKKNQREENTSRKVNRLSAIVFFITTAFFCVLLGVISPNTALAVVGIPIGFIVGILTETILKRYYRNLDKKETKNYKENEARSETLEGSQTIKLEESVGNKKKKDIEALRVLLDEGVITQEEYKKKALEIIDRKD